MGCGMRVGMVGINHKLADLKLREQLARISLQRLDPERSTHGEHHFVLLSTCNRTEIYFSSEDVALTHSYLLNILRSGVEGEFEQKLYTFFGEDCLMHLCRVAAGLDSAVIAETEIQGQVKNAYEKAHFCQKLPCTLHYLFQKSLKIAKNARALLPFKPGLPDIEHAVLQAGEQMFGPLQETKILFVGASRMNEKLLSYFKTRRLTNLALCNRSKTNGERISNLHQIPFLTWEALPACWHNYEWVILATSAPDYLIRAPFHSPLPDRKLLIDLSVPRNVDPAIVQSKQLTLLNIDQINSQLQIRRKTMELSLELAEELIQQAAQQHNRVFQERHSHKVCAAIA